MYKLLDIFIFLFIFTQTLIAKEPVLATLVTIVSNDVLEFVYENKKFSCLAYGVITVDDIYRKTDKDFDQGLNRLFDDIRIGGIIDDTEDGFTKMRLS